MEQNKNISQLREFQLENGIKIQVLPEQIKWGMNMYVQNEFIPGRGGEYQVAANHLIEHCVVHRSDVISRAETRSTFITHDFSFETAKRTEALEKLSSITNLLMTLNFDQQTIEREKRRVFEEMAAYSLKEEQFKFFGGFVKPVSIDEKDVIAEELIGDAGMDMLNRQANYNQSFTAEALNKQARFMYSGKNMTFRIKTPLNMEEFIKFIEESGLKKIPSQYTDAEQIKYQPVKEDIDYRQIPILKEHFEFNLSEKEQDIAKEIVRSIIKNAGNDSGLYWESRQILNEAGRSKFLLDFSITSLNSEKLHSSIQKTLAQKSSMDNQNAMERSVALKIQSQMLPDLTNRLRSRLKEGR